MSLEIYPTFPKVKTEQIDAVISPTDWPIPSGKFAGKTVFLLPGEYVGDATIDARAIYGPGAIIRGKLTVGPQWSDLPVVYSGALSSGYQSVGWPDGEYIIVSSIPWVNAYRSYYFQGERIIVAGGKAYIRYDYSSAKVVQLPNLDIYINGLTVLAGDDTGIEIRFARLFLENVSVLGNGNTLYGIKIIGSRGSLVNPTVSNFNLTAGTGYGISVLDGSHIEIWGGRGSLAQHAITAGGGTIPSSLTGTTSGAIPSSLIVNGGEWEAGKYGLGAVDAHGIVETFIVRNATINGEIDAHAQLNIIDGCKINMSDMGAGVYSSDGCNGVLKIINSTIIGKQLGNTNTPQPAIRISASASCVLYVDNCHIDVDYATSGSYSQAIRSDANAPTLAVISNSYIKQTGGDRLTFQGNTKTLTLIGNYFNISGTYDIQTEGDKIICVANRGRLAVYSTNANIEIRGYGNENFTSNQTIATNL